MAAWHRPVCAFPLHPLREGRQAALECLLRLARALPLRVAAGPADGASSGSMPSVVSRPAVGRARGQTQGPRPRPRRRRRATCNRCGGVRHLFAALDLAKDKLYGHIKPIKRRTQFLEFCRYLRSLYPPEVRIAIVCDDFPPHPSTKNCQRVGTWAATSNVEIAYTPTNSSWLNRIEARFTALRCFTLDGTDHATRKEQGSMIRRQCLFLNLRNTLGWPGHVPSAVRVWSVGGPFACG